MWTWRKPQRAKARRPEEPTPSIWISAGLLDRTATVLQESGDRDRPHEGVAYWAGRRVGHDSFVPTCIAPAAVTTYGSFGTTAQANAKVVMYLANAGLELIGQVHSHPGRFVGHSNGDDQRALMPYEGFLSVVVPHYARGGMRPLTICGIHLFANARFRRLTDAEIDARFHVVEDFADLRL